MNGMDLMRGLSEVEDSMLMLPRKHVSLRTNVLLGFLSANAARFYPIQNGALAVIAWLGTFYVLYAVVSWAINRNRKRKLLIEENGEQSPET